MATDRRALNSLALMATVHCLTGCAIGEVAGWRSGPRSASPTSAPSLLAIVLAFLFGYGLTSLPLLRSGMALGAVVPIAFASDTLSIATMEVVDNLIVLTIPGAMNAGLDSLLFWGSLAFALVVAGLVALPVNRWLIARGKGHAVVHQAGAHGWPRNRRRSRLSASIAVSPVPAITVSVRPPIQIAPSSSWETWMRPARSIAVPWCAR